MSFNHELVKSYISHERDYQIWHCIASHKYKHGPPYHLSKRNPLKGFYGEDCKMILLLRCSVVTTRQPAPPLIQGGQQLSLGIFKHMIFQCHHWVAMSIFRLQVQSPHWWVVVSTATAISQRKILHIILDNYDMLKEISIYLISLTHNVTFSINSHLYSFFLLRIAKLPFQISLISWVWYQNLSSKVIF